LKPIILTGDFTSGKDRELDRHLAPYDVLGTIAHVRMLESIGLLTENELSALEKELRVIYRMIEAGEFKIEPGVEDVHSQIELMLTEALGDTGKKVHTARSRNDQVLLDLKLFVRDRLMEIVNQTVRLSGTLINLSNKHKGTLMPGYTHMQVAMPSSFGLWFGAYAESLAEDLILLKAAYCITNQNPLGSAAGFGSSFPIDRSMTTELLGFDNMHVNVVNAQMNRGKMEKTVAFALGTVGSTLSRMAGDICIYSGQNFGFMTLPDEFTTGSSIMPHKKNPDIFELIRATGNKLQALPVEIMLISSNLPSGYHRDFQIIKENFIPAFDLLISILSVTEMVIGRIKVNPEIIDKEIYNDLFSVEEVNRLVKQGLPFREAYKKVAGRIGE
jgi:argininosuccinate lyase